MIDALVTGAPEKESEDITLSIASSGPTLGISNFLPHKMGKKRLGKSALQTRITSLKEMP